MATNDTSPRTSTQFCDPDADVVFRSCDGVLFRIHKQYLHHTCGSFPPAELPSDGEVVSLTEAAKVLDLLFAFVYPRRHPFLDDLDAMTLFALAEAVEKYEVFAGMGICLIRMKEQVVYHPIRVLNYAAKHGYSGVMDEAAYITVGLSLKTIAQSMDINIMKAWLIYNQSWLDLVESKLNFETHFIGDSFILCPDTTKLIHGLAVPEALKNKIVGAFMKHAKPGSCDSYCVLRPNLAMLPWDDAIMKISKFSEVLNTDSRSS